MIRRPRTTGIVYTDKNTTDDDTTFAHSLTCSSEEDNEEWMPPEPPGIKRAAKKPAAKMAAKPKEPKVPKPRAPRKPPAEKKPRAPRALKAPGLPKTTRGKKQVEEEKEGEKEVAEGEMEGKESKLTGRLKEERVSFIVPEGPPLEGGEGSSSGSWGMTNKKEEPEEDFTFDEPCPKRPKTSAVPLGQNNGLPMSNPEGSGEGRSMNWDLTELLSELTGIQQWVCINIVQLLSEDNTVPFMVRYRKDMINHMDADTVRDVLLVLEEIRALTKKTQTVIQTLKKDEVLTAELEQNLRSCRSADELDHLYAPYKKSSKPTKARRAKLLGLDAAAQALLQSPSTLDLRTWVRPGTEGLSTIEEVAMGVEQILSEIIAKDPETLTFIRSLCERNMVTLQSSVAKAALKEQKEKERGQHQAKQGQDHKDKSKDLDKFHLYWDFTCNVQCIQPHQTLAINRGESLKILTVKVNIPDRVKSDFTRWCINVRWRTKTFASEDQRKIISDAVEGSYKRLLLPLLTRIHRSKLTASAQKESIALFVRNLRQRLLVCPIRGCVLMAVDPGFRHGCKLAILSPTSQILQTDVVFLHSSGQQREAEKLRHLMLKFSCSRVVIGNGTACRETESFFADLINRRFFHPLDVSYCITNEAGASIYSVSPEAVKEMPDLDPNLRSAVSIGRRVQDPLAELVKIDPKHIGIGTYQHDVSASALKAALDGVVQECVSFVGVDISICSVTLMRHVAGLNAGRAQSIAEWRERNGPFTNREQLRLVKGLGPKSYQQCAGFIRINPQGLASNRAPEPSPSSSSVLEKPTAKKSRAKASVPTEPNPLDRTCIHPESYDVALRFLSLVGGSADQLGSPALRQGVEGRVRASGMEALAKELDTSPETLQLIVDGLTQPPGFDIRQDFEQADFKRGIVSMGDLQVGAVLTGRVANATLFGAFVDIGVGRDGLIHKSNIRPDKLPADHRRRSLALGPGERVEVQVLNVDLQRGRIGLDLLRVLR